MDTKSITVFLVEDHTLVRQALRHLIEAVGIRVVGEAASCETALGDIERLRPDVAIVDLSLPGASGFEATREIVALDGPTRVLILSMFADEEHLRRALEAGAGGYVLKDTNSADLMRAIRSVCDGDAFFSPRIAAFIAASHRPPAPGPGPDGAIRLSPREREILRLIALGMTGKAIAQSLDISPGTVETHRRRLMAKLGVAKVAELTLYAVRQGIITPERA